MSELPTVDAPQTCSLSWPEQRWNLILFAVCTGTQYLAAPVLYVASLRLRYAITSEPTLEHRICRRRCFLP